MVDQHVALTIYPSRIRLAGYTLLFALVAAVALLPQVAAVHGVLSLHTLPSPGWIGGELFGLLLGLLGCLCDLLLLFTLYRLIVRKPALTATASGIVDGCSLIAGGMGLVRWDQMTGLYPFRWGPRDRHAYLVITLSTVGKHDVLNRRGPLVRGYRRAISLILPGSLGLPEWLLSTSVEEVYRHILAHYAGDLKAHGVYAPTPHPHRRSR